MEKMTQTTWLIRICLNNKIEFAMDSTFEYCEKYKKIDELCIYYHREEFLLTQGPKKR